MAVPGLSSLLTEVETAVGACRSDAVDAPAKAFRAKAPPLEVIRAAARAGATQYARMSGVAARTLAARGVAANLRSLFDPPLRALPVLHPLPDPAADH